ncbi:MAG: peptidylprolyl isomerase [Salinivirgaceae bacterium]|nr:peptidylprolyl isomerase [Salinivirgaceae bacterium]
MKRGIIALAIAATMPAMAQNSSEATVLTIDNKAVSVGEFERLYTKNNTNATFDSLSLSEYMQLFIDYKLKVTEAEQLGMDTTADFHREFDEYCTQLEKPYFTDPSVDDSLAREAYEHLQWIVRASHILVNCSPDASAADSLKAYKRIENIRNRALKGEDFAKLARTNSDDPSVSRNSGDLGFFTAFSMIYEFEKMAYLTEIGAVSPIFRTRFGYHILKVTDRRPNPGQVNAAHLMIRVDQKADEATKKAAADKIKMISDSLAAGADWAQMVSRYSEDPGTRNRQGNLQWFAAGEMVPEFEETTFSLKNIGDISKPVLTSYGWHIIKLLGKRQVDPFENLQEQIKKRLSRDVRSQMAQKAVIERLKKSYNFTEDKAALNELAETLDTTIWHGQWDANKAKGLDKTIFSIADTVRFTQSDYAKILAHHDPMNKKIPVEIMLKDDYEKLVEKSIMDFERKQLTRKYPEFGYLRTEYHDGILLFALMDKMVWTKASTDSAGLEQFHKANKQNYMWGERFEIASCSYIGDAIPNTDKKNVDTKIIAALKAGTKKGDYEKQVRTSMTKLGIEPDSIGMGGDAGKYNIVDGKWCDIDGIRIDKDSWGKAKSKVMNHEGRSYVFYLVRKLSPTPKTLNECRGAAIADYQNKLEADWIELLHKKHTVKINEPVFKSLIKK